MEANTTRISKDLASKYQWSRYDFKAHATTRCLKADEHSDKDYTNYNRLHITSDRFDDPRAINLVEKHTNSVSIHGYGSHRTDKKGVICVGGRNNRQITAFINYVNAQENTFSSYNLEPIDATEDINQIYGEPCYGLKGRSAKNIVNRNASNNGGLQLKLALQMRKDLVNSSSRYNELRNVIYGGIWHAMNVEFRR